MSDDLLYAVEDGIARLTLNRPSVFNAISFEMWDRILDILLEVEFTPSVRCLVIDAVGENFCAGTDIGDLSVFAKLTPTERSALFSKRMEGTNRVFTAMERIAQPILCSVRGIAYGGGFGMAVGGDLAICSETTRFQVATLNLGSVPDCGAPIQLTWTMGLKKAKQYCLLEENMPAKVALDYGLINWIVPDSELETETMKIARKLAAAPQPGTGFTKAMLNASCTRTLTEHLKQEAADVGRCVSEPGYVDRVNAFIARRAAKRSSKG